MIEVTADSSAELVSLVPHFCHVFTDVVDTRLAHAGQRSHETHVTWR